MQRKTGLIGVTLCSLAFAHVAAPHAAAGGSLRNPSPATGAPAPAEGAAAATATSLVHLVLQEVSKSGDTVVLAADGSRVVVLERAPRGLGPDPKGEGWVPKTLLVHCADGAAMTLSLRLVGEHGSLLGVPAVEPSKVQQPISATGTASTAPSCAGVQVTSRVAGAANELAAPGSRAVLVTKSESYSAHVTNAALQKQVVAMGVGSTVNADLSRNASGAAGWTVTRLAPLTEPADGGIEIIFFLLAACILGLLTVFLLRPAVGNGIFQKLAMGADNRYSSSKFQTAVWFGILMISYLATILLRLEASHGALLGGVSLPQNLLVLSGLSAITFVGAKAVKVGQISAANARAGEAAAQSAAANAAANTAAARAAAGGPALLGPPAADAQLQAQAAAMTAAVAANSAAAADNKVQTLTSQAAQPSFPADLFSDGSESVDFAKFQMIVLVLIAAGTYVLQIWQFLSIVPLQAQIELPDVNPALLATFGLGQGAYLIKKAAGSGT
jgi:hypothetical protein